ncbi:MAG: hypothetical protein ACRCX2_07920 [Paraclostridium sp.]
MKYNITLSQETLNKVVEMLEGENALNVAALEKAKNRVVVLEREMKGAQDTIDSTLQTNTTVLFENDRLIKRIQELEEQIVLSDFEAEKTKNSILEKKLENNYEVVRTLQEAAAKEREDFKDIFLGVLSEFNVKITSEITTLMDKCEYYKVAAKINAEISSKGKTAPESKEGRLG